MASKSNFKLPFINLMINESPESVKSSSWIEACKSVTRALEEYGCFIAVHDKFSSEVSDSIFLMLQDLFNLPLEIKVQNTSETPFFGYWGPSPSNPLGESTSIVDPTDVEAVQRFTKQMWHSGNHHFSEMLQSYAKKMMELDELVSKMVFESYGVEKYHASHVGSVTYVVRLNKYRVPEQHETNLGAATHTDKNFITMLHQNEANGLEVQLKNGSWIAVDFPPSSVVIMAGDALSAWSNGRVHSPLHKVTMSGKETRYSIAQFSYGKQLVQTPEELVDDEHPLLYKPFDNFGLLYFIITDKGVNAENQLKAYCGV